MPQIVIDGVVYNYPAVGDPIVTEFDRLKQYLASDGADEGTWRVDLAPGIPCAITLGPMPEGEIKNRSVIISIREDDVHDVIISKLQNVSTKPQRITLPDGVKLIQFYHGLRDG